MTISILERPEPKEPFGGLRLGSGLGRGETCRWERRRSDRVEPGRALSSDLHRVGPCRVISIGLGGVTLDSPSRIEPGVSHRLLMKYGGLRAEIDIVTHRTKVEELFYAGNGHSWIRYRSHAVFREPSVEALNLVYRIIGDHWVAPEDDDTRPASS
jgi:hypothetical protein